MNGEGGMEGWLEGWIGEGIPGVRRGRLWKNGARYINI